MFVFRGPESFLAATLKEPPYRDRLVAFESF